MYVSRKILSDDRSSAGSLHDQWLWKFSSYIIRLQLKCNTQKKNNNKETNAGWTTKMGSNCRLDFTRLQWLITFPYVIVPKLHGYENGKQKCKCFAEPLILRRTHLIEKAKVWNNKVWNIWKSVNNISLTHSNTTIEKIQKNLPNWRGR